MIFSFEQEVKTNAPAIIAITGVTNEIFFMTVLSRV
jgi:hypothetical protein